MSEIQTPQGFAAETASAALILTSANLGFALSTTQVATGSIFGAGAGRRLATVQWSVAGQMAVAWLLTLPAAAVVGAVAAVGRLHRHRGHDPRRGRADRARGWHLRRVPPQAGDRRNVNDVPAPVPALAAA